MLNMLKYDLNKYKRGIIILTAIVGAFFLVFNISSSLVRTNGEMVMDNSYILYPHAIIFSVLAIITPFFNLRFKMNKVTVDQLYSLPIKRKKLFLEKYILGLIEILIPLTIAIVLTGLIVPFKDSFYTRLYFLIPYYFVLFGFVVIMYTISAFFFTRCNTIVDGILVALGILFLPLAINLAAMLGFNFQYGIDDVTSKLNIFSNLDYVTCIFEDLMKNTLSDGFLGFLERINLYSIGFYVLATILCFIGYYFLNPRDKAENATQISSSIFAYRLLIPIYSAIIAFFPTFNVFALPIFILFAAIIYLFIVIYLRSVKRKDRIYIYSYIAFLAAIIFRIFLH